MGYLLSIIIPTKDRYQYLSKTLVNLSELDSELVEIVVQDNTIINGEILNLINKINQDNIKYFHESKTLSQTDNSNLALEHATGEYCCYIGDDDTVFPDLLDVVFDLKARNIEACITDEANFYWPDVVFEKKRPWLKYNTKKFKNRFLRSGQILAKSMSYGMQDIMYLPRVYHGIVSKKVLDIIHRKTGTYFPGPSPDMANAVACALEIDEYLYTEKPLILSGVGYTSGAGMGQRGAHKGDLKSGKQLPADAEKMWSHRIPKLWLGYTVWTESAEKSMIAMGHSEILGLINIEAMEAKIFLKYPEYRKLILNRVNSPIHAVKLLGECIRFGIRYFSAEIKLYLRKQYGLVITVTNSIEFDEAYQIVLKSNQEMQEDKK